MVDKDLWLPSRLTFPAIGAKTDRGPDDIAFFNFYKHILGSEKGHITSLSISGVIEKNAKYFNSKLINMGGRLIHKAIADNSTIHSFHWNEALFDINYQTNGTVYINGISINEKLINDISELFKKHFTTKSKQGYIFAILRQGSSLMMQKVGFAGIPLIKENYKNEVIEDFHHIIKDLKSPSPSGRIAIFDGPMGSGKTHLIRGLLMEVPSALFVLVPPAMVSSIGGPRSIFTTAIAGNVSLEGSHKSLSTMFTLLCNLQLQIVNYLIFYLYHLWTKIKIQMLQQEFYLLKF